MGPSARTPVSAPEGSRTQLRPTLPPPQAARLLLPADKSARWPDGVCADSHRLVALLLVRLLVLPRCLGRKPPPSCPPPSSSSFFWIHLNFISPYSRLSTATRPRSFSSFLPSYPPLAVALLPETRPSPKPAKPCTAGVASVTGCSLWASVTFAPSPFCGRSSPPYASSQTSHGEAFCNQPSLLGRVRAHVPEA